jgi:PqqD family protein of HPr-rel-A system
MRRVLNLDINDEGFVFDPSTGESFLTNGTGVAILQALQQGKGDKPALVQQMVSAFNVSPDLASRDVGEFLSRLNAMRLM